MQLNPHFFDLLSEFNAARARYLVVGAHVLNYYGRPRTTGDLDLWVEPTRKNAESVFRALSRFGAPLEFSFATAWKNRRRARYGTVPICLISERDFIRNKRAVGRTRDLADAEEIEQLLRHAKREKRS